jgi:integrase
LPEGTGKPEAHPRLLWPEGAAARDAIHDLRHTFATELLAMASTCTVCSG